MNTRRHLARSVSVIALATGLFAVSPEVRAQAAGPDRADAPATPLGSSLTGEAKGEYESAHNLFEISDFDGALLKFKHAFELSGDPRLLWNMAACEKELHHYGGAVVLVERLLRDNGTRVSSDLRERATATLAALRSLSSAATLTGVPAGAKVYVDEQLVGETPLPSPLALDLGSRKLRVEHPDYEPFEKTVEGVTGGKEIAIAIAMKPLSAGRLTVIAGPGDTIALDGKVVGTERWESSVPPGTHKLRVTAVGKAPYEADVELAPRGARSVQVSLLAQSKAALWPWLVGGGVLVAGAVVGGYFLFKPKDEPGAYTSGGLGTVMLPSSMRFR